MTAKLNTPYDGSSRLFQIGLKPLEIAEWIDVDDNLLSYLAEKERLFTARPDDVFAAEAETTEAQAEVLALLSEHLVARFPEIYARQANEIVIAGDHRVVLDDAGVPPLRVAAALVQEDLVLMRRGEADWRLAAASLSFPSSWSLREKFRRPIHEVHGPVPGFNAGTRNAELIARMFDHLRPEMPVIRWNWSIYGDEALFHPESASPETRRFGTGARAENVFLRVERQTLRRLPRSRDILFTIRIYVDPLEALERLAEAPAIATSLINQLMTLSDEQLSYKGLTLERNRLAARLRQIAER
jgi:hypothetical protein